MAFWIIIILIIALAVLLCFLLAVANHSGERFMDKYHEMNKIFAKTSLSPMEFINLVQKRYLKKKVEIVQISNVAGDAYYKGKLFLSGDTLNVNSLASYTIIAHEMGHALQDIEGKKLKKLVFLRKFGKFLSYFMMPSLISGIILMFFEKLFIAGVCLAVFSVLIFFLALIIKILTISLEKDASKKAETFLKDILDEKETKMCKTFLNDARLTYWAEFLRILLFWTGASRKVGLFN